MPRPSLDAGWSFVIAGSLASSVAGHLVIQTLGERGRLETPSYGTYAHVALGPAIVLAIVSALLATCAFVRNRRTNTFGPNDALVREASAIVRFDSRALVAYVAILQLILLYLMETAEHVLAFGNPTSGLDWLGGDVPITLGVHLTLACMTALTLRRAGRGLVFACDRAIALIEAFVASLRRLLERDASPRAPRRRRIVTVTALAARCVGLRAPPARS